jgi:2-phosphosulfolactate phosphatase
MALDKNAKTIIAGSFANLSAVCTFLTAQKQNVILGCAAWKDKVNIEDSLFAGAVISRIKSHFNINCDSSQMAEILYNEAKADLFEFVKSRNISHYQRLASFGLEKDMRYCLTDDLANVLAVYEDGKLLTRD